MQTYCNELLAIAQEAGLFIVPGGALESWLKDVVQASPSQKPQWFQAALRVLPLTAVGKDEDIWAFVLKVLAFLKGVSRS